MGPQGPKGDIGGFDETTKRQIVMIDKDFEKKTYEDNSGNVKGTFQEFQFTSSGSSAPYNEGYGRNLTITRETEKEKIPLLGFRAPLRIEQDSNSGDSLTKIAFSTPQTRQNQYGMLFAVKFLNDTVKAENSMAAFTDGGGVDTLQSIKGLNSNGITVNGNRYFYFLVKVAADAQSRTETTVQFNFTTSKLKNGKMNLEIYEGFTFNNFSDGDYASANLTTHTPYPHQKDFDKHKFQDAMTGDVLLAGTKQTDGTVQTNESLRLVGANLQNAIPFHYTVLLPYVSPNANSDGWAGAYAIHGGYPAPIFPVIGTGQILITLLTHSFDKDGGNIPSSIFTLQYRLILYNESQATTSVQLLDQVDYNHSDYKRSINCFYLHKRLSYDPPSTCIGFSLEFKQILPATARGNESRLFFNVQQEMKAT